MGDPASLIVSEVFGPTIQGEGPSVGRRAGFVRLGRCNLACTWCDTPYTWDWSRFDPAVELRRAGVAEVVAEVEAMDVPLVVVTGGEPLLQQSALVELLAALAAPGRRIEVETAGTLAPSPELVALVDQFNVSPKLANSGNPVERRWRPGVLGAFSATGKAIFKFVVTGPDDLAEVATMDVAPVWIMPEGTDPAVLQRRLAELVEPVLARGWNLTPRLHVAIWGDRRGV
ncbi:MAG TPA: 7-carboxy-7-deazaguanine synthase QueE [Acidimicrobiales bacterium]|nr:7-carboxy-7-deazaguanine synthase QueE [Acidimicrobiales bacterium]